MFAKLALRLVCTGLLLTSATFAQDLQRANQHMGAGEWEAAIAELERVLASEPENGEATFKMGYCLHIAGRLDEAHDFHVRAARFAAHAPLAHYNHACVHALKSEMDEAFRALDEARGAGFDDVQQVLVDGDLDNLRHDPRFQKLLFELSPALDRKPGDQALTPGSEADFLVGVWRVIYRRRNPDGSFSTMSTIVDNRSVCGGGAVEGDWYSPAPDGLSYLGSALIRKHPEAGHWETRWFEAATGDLREPEALAIEGNKLVARASGEDEHGAYNERMEMFPAGANEYAFRVRRNYEGRDGWMVVAASDCTRIQGMRVQQPALLNPAAPDLTHQLAFTLGDWKATHERHDGEGEPVQTEFRVEVSPALAGYGLRGDWYEVSAEGEAYLGSSLSRVHGGAWHREWHSPLTAETFSRVEELSPEGDKLVSVRQEEDDFGTYKMRKTYAPDGEGGFGLTVERKYVGTTEWVTVDTYRFRK